MASDIIDFIASFAILITVLGAAIYMSTQTLDNALVYQQNQLVSSTATETFNTIIENPGSPSNWGETGDPITSFGLQWASTGIDSLSPFTPLRLLKSPLTVIYDGVPYRDLSDLSGTSLLLRTSEQITYDQASQLLNLNGKYGWRLNYTAALDVSVTAWNPPPPSSWYWGWSYRTKVIIDHTKVLGNFNDYPVLLSITDTDLKTYALSTGYDILFTDADGTTKLSHEIESYDSSTGKLIVWVNVPSLSSWYDTELYMYFGNAAAPDQQNPTGTWNLSYLFVSHMKDDPDNSHIADSTANGLDGTKTAMDEPVQSSGKISYAQRFDGSNDAITLPPKVGLSYTGFTFDFWAKSTPQQQTQTILSTGAKSNSAGFIDITRSPSSYDLSFDYASDSAWLEKGLPILDGIEVKCLAYFNGKIYAGTGDGRLFEWDGSTFWTLKAPQLGTETSINSLAVYNSKLYGGTGPNGKLYEWDGSGAWISRATLGAGTNILSLAVFGSTSKLYGGSSNGKLLEWTTGATVWTERAPQLGSETSIYSLTSFGSPAELYGSTGPNGKLYKWNGVGAWLDQITPASIYSTIQFNGKIYGGTSGGELYEWDSTELKWIRRAPKLGSETDIICLAEFGGALYAGTSPGGRLYQWNGVDAWTQVAPQLGTETSIKSLIVYNSKLFGGTSPNGKLYEWNGVDAWVEDAGPALIHSLAFFNNKIYGGSFTGALYEWDGTAGQWLLKAPRLGAETDIVTLAVFNGKLYGGTSPNGKLYEWNDVNAWVQKAGQLNGQTKINSLAVYNGKLYGSTSPGGRLFEWNGVNTWAEAAPQLGAETSINSLAVYGTPSKLYGGTGPNGKLYEWNGVNQWVEKAPQLFSETSINSLAVYNGKLYGGTSPNGKLYEWNDINAWVDQLGGWGYRKSHVINPSAGAGTNYQVKITAYYGSGTDSGANVYLNGKCRTDFGDVRFTSSDGTTLLDYWIESKVDGNNAVFWVEVADDLSTSAATIYLYYGKSDATTTSNGSNTFILFDDFNGPSLDASKWTQKNGGALTFASSQMTATANAVDPGKIIATGGPTGNNLVLRARFKVTGGTNVDERAGLGVKTGTADGKGYNYVLRDFTNLDERSFLNDGVVWNVRAGSWLKNTWYTEEVYHDGSKINGRFDDGSWQSQAWSGRTGYPALNIGSFNSVTVWDWALIRKIVSSEPSHGSWVETSLGSETSINSLAVYNGKLYGGTSPNGKLYEWNDVNAWVQKADTKNGQNTINSLVVDTVNTKLYAATSPDGLLFEWKPVPGEWDPKTMTSTITSVDTLAVFNGKLYGGTSPNGKLYEWDGSTAWVEKAGQLNGQTKINSLAVYGTPSKLYGGTSPGGRLFEWNGVNAWAEKAPQLGVETSINSLVVFNGNLYGGTNLNGKLYQWNGVNAWIEKAPKLGLETSINSLAVYNSKLYGGTSPNGKIYEWNDINAWVDRITPTYISSLAVYNSKIYGGTSYGALYEWDSTALKWVQKAPRLGSETKIVSLITFNGKLYGGTSPNGKLYEWSTGATVWTEKANTQLTQTSINALVVNTASNKLYGGTGPNGCLLEWDGTSSWASKAYFSQVASTIYFNNKLYVGTSRTGELFEWNGINGWTRKASQLSTETSITSLAEFNGNLYAGTSPGGRLYQWDGLGAWTQKAPQLGTETSINNLASYNSKLYGGTSPNGKLYEWNGVGAWVQKANILNSQTSINSLLVFNMELFGGTSPGGRLFKWDGSAAWIQMAPQLGAETSINSLASYNSKLYGGTSPNGKLYEWNGVNTWIERAPKLVAETSINSIIVYNDKLFGGTSPSGKLYEWNTVDAWVEKADTLNQQSDVKALVIDSVNNRLCAGTLVKPFIFEFSDSSPRVATDFFKGYDDAWIKISIVADYSGKTLQFYRNGVLFSALTITSEFVAPTFSPIYVGSFANKGNYFKGYIDELRVSTLARPDKWIGTTYSNEANPENFYTMGTIESLSGLKLKISVKSINGVLPKATLDVNLFYCDHGNPPEISQAQIKTVDTDQNGEAVINYPELSTDITSLILFTNNVYGGTHDGRLLQWDGVNAWVQVASQLGVETNINSLAEFNGNLYAGTYPNGMLYQWDGTSTWVQKAPKLGSETSINSLAVYNGKLYGGTSPNGKLYEWNGVNAWVEKSPQLDGWGYRKSHVINPSAGAGTNYQVKITAYYGSGTDSGANVYLNGKCRTDFGDVRFTSSDGTTLLDYWIESKVDGNNAVFWVEVADDLSTSAATIYLYYGKSDATTTSNGSNTFIFFDDFSGNLSKWTIEKTSSVYPRIENGYLVCGGGTTTDPYGHTSIGSSATYSGFQDGIIEGKLYLTTNSIGEIAFRGNYAGNTGYKARLDVRSGQGLSYLKPPYSGWVMIGTPTGLPVGTGAWKNFKVTVAGSSFTIEADGQTKTCSDATYTSTGEIALQNHYGSYTYYDDVRVRKYCATEPTQGGWVETSLDSETSINSLTVYNGKLYGGTSPNGRLYEWNDVNAWVQKADTKNGQNTINSLLVFNMELFGGTSPGGRLYQWDGVNAWVQVASQLGSETSINSLAVFNGKLYGGTSPNGKLYEWDGSTAWVEKAGQLNGQTKINSLAVYGTPSKLYGGTSPGGRLFEWDGSSAWIQRASVANRTFFAAVRARYTSLYGVGYTTCTPESDMTPFVTSYENGIITLVHKKYLDAGYSYNGKLNYTATMALPVGYSEFRNVQIANPTGVISSSAGGVINLGALKSDPGIVMIFTRRPDTGKYAVTIVPWGLTLGSDLTLGETPLDATNVVSKSRIVMLGRYTYMVTLEMWEK